MKGLSHRANLSGLVRDCVSAAGFLSFIVGLAKLFYAVM